MKKCITPPVIVLMIFIVTVFVVFNLLKQNHLLVSPVIKSGLSLNISPTTIFSPTPSPSGEYNILLLGQGDPSHEGGNLIDSLTVIHLNTDNKSAAMIFIPRDIWVVLPQNSFNKDKAKINEAYSVGTKAGDDTTGLKFSEQVANLVTDLSINNAILIDFNNFTKAIDALGGIEITVPKTFDDYFYPVTGKELETCGKTPEDVAALSATMSGFLLEKQFTCRYEHLHFDAGKTRIDGKAALKFARSRHSNQDGTDFARGLRQQAIILGIKDKLLSLDVLDNVEDIFNKFVKTVKTDLDLSTTKSIASLIIEPNNYKITQIILSDQNVLASSKSSSGQYILIPKAGDGNWNEVHNYIKGLIDN